MAGRFRWGNETSWAHDVVLAQQLTQQAMPCGITLQIVQVIVRRI